MPAATRAADCEERIDSKRIGDRLNVSGAIGDPPTGNAIGARIARTRVTDAREAALPGDLDVEVMQVPAFRCAGVDEDVLVAFPADPDREPPAVGGPNLTCPTLQYPARLQAQKSGSPLACRVTQEERDAASNRRPPPSFSTPNGCYSGALLLLSASHGKEWASRRGVGTVGATLLVFLALGPGIPPAQAEAEPTTECRRGETLQALERLGLAEEAYLEDLKTQASVGCGRRHLEQLGEVSGLCTTAEALAASGQKGKAKEAYVKALEADPESTCAANALEASPDESEHWWEWAATAARDAVGVAGFISIAIACGAILLWLFLAFQMRGKKSKRRWPARLLLTPSLEVKPLDDTGVDKKMGSSVASLIRSRVKPRHSGGIDVVTGHSALGGSLQPLGDISSEAKAAVAVVSFLLATLPRRNYEAAGALQAKGERGRGISIELMNGSKQLAATTLWGNDFEAPDEDGKAFQLLSVPTAAWLDHRIATALEEGDDLPADPQSWALFRAGAAWQEEGDYAKARSLHESALAIDPGNMWATANLGAIEALDGNYVEALELLTTVLEALEGESS